MRISKRSILATAAVTALALGAVSASIAVAKDPAGNNGTVKVDGEPFDSHPGNEPHVGGCTFQIDFYGFDEGDLFADVVFDVKPPSGSGTVLAGTVFIGEDDKSGGGSEAGLDAEAMFSLVGLMSGFEEHPDQGYHVKMTVHADGSQGADTKHKTFWVTDCDAPPPPPPPPTDL